MKRYHNLRWDERNIYHIAVHHVIPDEVEQVVFSSKCRVRRGRGQNTYYILGQAE